MEHEHEGKERAEYGKALPDDLAGRLTKEYGKGDSVQALRNMRQFYLVFSKRSALRSELTRERRRIEKKHLGDSHDGTTGTKEHRIKRIQIHRC